jgi:ABC-2 type transport system ATP-binding protein
VKELRRQGDRIEIIGSGNLLHAVISVLARDGIVAAELTLEQASLDDAFVNLTRGE